MTTGTFEWDDRKDAENQSKHQVSFYAAQAAFVDPHRVIAHDVAHSGVEERFYCIGAAEGGGVLGTGCGFRSWTISIFILLKRR